MHDPEQRRQDQEQCREIAMAVEQEQRRRQRACHQRRARRVAGPPRHHQPDQAEGDRARPEQAEQHADIGRDALAALEAEPDRKQVAEKRAECGDHRGRRSAEVAGDDNGHGAFQHVAEQRRGGQALAAGAQHVGRADIAGADRAQILRAGDLRQDHAERDRAEQVADDKGKNGHDVRRCQHQHSCRVSYGTAANPVTTSSSGLTGRSSLH